MNRAIRISFAMQEVEGSSPFSRFDERPAATAFPCLPARSTHRAGRHFVDRLPIGCQEPPGRKAGRAATVGKHGSAPGRRVIIVGVDTVAALERGREAYLREAWLDAYESLWRVDREVSLAPHDLACLATCAYMIGRESEYRDVLERAHRVYLEAGDELAALRCAFWIGVTLASHGEIGRASGWLRRARRLLERQEGDRVEHGYLLLPTVFEQGGERRLGGGCCYRRRGRCDRRALRRP